MNKTKILFKNLIYIILILTIILLYKNHEKNIQNNINSFDFFIIKIAINNDDNKTFKYKIKNIEKQNKKYIDSIYSLLTNLSIKENDYKIKNTYKKFLNVKKILNNKIIKNKINIFK
jgi:hypothetical protein